MLSPLSLPLQGANVRGGWRQRLEQAAPAARPPSLQALGLLRDWGDGLVSSAHVCKHMRYAVLDGSGHPMIQKLGNVSMECSTNHAAAQALMSLMEKCGFGDLITELEGAVASHICLPSDLISCIHNTLPDKFVEVLGADKQNIRAFGGSLSSGTPFR